MKKGIVIALSLVFTFIVVGCQSEVEEQGQIEQEETDLAAGGIELTQQIQGVFKQKLDGDQVIIEHNGTEETYSTKDGVVGDLDTVQDGEAVYFSYGTKEDGTLVLETLRLGE
ncbi:hypothetical protein [Alkalihalobacillus sp. LMS39]|uniref:hypothetical protein n=1 Tax=Alkalihalobacillus sp. LMS39 TaxID=2924032 RepID=UPI001FB28990|nr:hypothetical protein [Alkalihalobacillus sp. LMS39]UOE94328.1 hypothetical protein MM271_01165 [Alkalihalobacillus sp. LMS39]